jgi:ferric enterobactin receptor
LLVNQNLTLGTEWNQQRMKDMASNTQTLQGGDSGLTARPQPVLQAEIFSVSPKTTWS